MCINCVYIYILDHMGVFENMKIECLPPQMGVGVLYFQTPIEPRFSTSPGSQCLGGRVVRLGVHYHIMCIYRYILCMDIQNMYIYI